MPNTESDRILEALHEAHRLVSTARQLIEDTGASATSSKAREALTALAGQLRYPGTNIVATEHALFPPDRHTG